MKLHVVEVALGDGLVDRLIDWGCSDLANDSIRRNIHPGGPDDGVDYELAEAVIGPVLVEVAAGEAETAGLCRVFNRPCERLRLLEGEFFPHLRVSRARAVGAERALRR